MKVLIPMKQVHQIRAIGNGMLAQVEMTQEQMFAALNCFLDCVSDDTWAQWQRQINAEIYGQPQVVTT